MGLGFLFVFLWAKPLRAKPASIPQHFVWDRVSKYPCLTWNSVYVDQAGFKLHVPTASASVLGFVGLCKGAAGWGLRPRLGVVPCCRLPQNLSVPFLLCGLKPKLAHIWFHKFYFLQWEFFSLVSWLRYVGVVCLVFGKVIKDDPAKAWQIVIKIRENDMRKLSRLLKKACILSKLNVFCACVYLCARLHMWRSENSL